ncbi:MAG: DUF47 family protein [Candidatus Lokiarchaeota archaeon]|nr:DUF47 family protein [Candidatus Lokiarchaeota archaeon]
MILEYEEKELKKKSIDELTHLFMDIISKQNLVLIEGIEYLIDENHEQFNTNMNHVIETTTEVQVKKAFESKIFKSKLIFSKADRLKLFNKINEIKNIGEFMANRMLVYRIIFPDNEFKLRLSRILDSLKLISTDLSTAVKSIGTDLNKAHDICEEIKEERRKMRKIEFQLIHRLYHYDMDYLSRTFLYLKDMVEDVMMLADHIKTFSEYIQFLSIKYLIFK